MFFNLKLPITDEVSEQARNWRECPTGERLFESLLGSGTTIPQCLTKKITQDGVKIYKTHPNLHINKPSKISHISYILKYMFKYPQVV